MQSSEDQIREQVEDAILHFSLGEDHLAAEKLQALLAVAPECFDGWLALTEVELARRNLDCALSAAEKALQLKPEDIHVHTSLSRIWVEKGDKEKAEHHGAQARMLGWKDELGNNPSGDGLNPGHPSVDNLPG